MTLYQLTDFLILFILRPHAEARRSVNAKNFLLQAQDLPEMTIAATRSSYKLTDVPTPAIVIGQEQIQSPGASRLEDVLAEETGLAITCSIPYDHGFAVRIKPKGMQFNSCKRIANGQYGASNTFTLKII